MNIELLATILLIGRAVSVSFIVWVLLKQIYLFRLPIDPSVSRFRRLLFLLSLAILAINVVPTGIDILTLLVPVDRPPVVTLTGVTYALSNSIGMAFESFLVWLIYRTASRSHEQ